MVHPHDHMSKYESKFCQKGCGCPWTAFSYLESRQRKIPWVSVWPWVTLQNSCLFEEERWDKSQPTRLHFYFLSDFSEVILILFSISPKQIRHLCFKSLVTPIELYRASLCRVTSSTLPRNTDEVKCKLQFSKLCFIKKPGKMTRSVRVFLLLLESPRTW